MSSRNPTSPSISRTASPKPFSECCNGRCGAVLTRRHDPPVLFKTIVYWAVVFLVRFLEKLVEYLFAGGTLPRDSGVRGDSLHLAPLCRYPDLDLRSVSDLHLGRRTECAPR